MRPFWLIRVGGRYPATSVPVRAGEGDLRQRGKRRLCGGRAEAAGARPRAQGSRESPAVGGARRTVPQSIWKEPTVLTSWSAASSLQKEDGVGFCCLSGPGSGPLLERPQDANAGCKGPDFESQP